MSTPLARGAEHRRVYRLHSLAGFALALVMLLAVFTAPVVAGEPDLLPLVEDEAAFDVLDVPQTDIPLPLPPPPAVLAPPVAVEDDAVTQQAVVDALDFDPDAYVAPPAPLTDPGPASPPPPPPPPAPPVAPPVVEPTDETLEFVAVEDQPRLIGGLAGLQARVVYPQMAIRAGIEGVVHVRFVVDKDGRVIEPVVLRSPSELLSQAALKAVVESRFQPGQQRGRPVKVRYSLPVRFTLR